MTDTKSCYHCTAVEQAMSEKIVVYVMRGTERDMAEGCGRDSLQGPCRGEIEKEGKKMNENEKEQK